MLRGMRIFSPLEYSREAWDGHFSCCDVDGRVLTRPSSVDLGLDAVGHSQGRSWSAICRLIHWIRTEYGICATSLLHNFVRYRDSQLRVLRPRAAKSFPLGSSAFASRISYGTCWRCKSKCTALASSSRWIRTVSLLVRRCLERMSCSLISGHLLQFARALAFEHWDYRVRIRDQPALPAQLCFELG
jgi:hypothetical protein